MTYILKASDIQPPDDPARELARKREKSVKTAIIAALSGLGDLLSTTAIIRFLQRFDIREVTQALESPEAVELIVKGYQPVADTFLEAAKNEVNDNLAGLIAYDPLTAMLPLQALRDQLSKTLTTTARSAVQAALLESIRTGVPAETIAKRLRAVIGLDNQQQRAVANYRRMLENGDSTALRRALRDQRYDDLVRRAVRGQKPMSAEQIEEAVQAYAARALDHRAQTIASTETMQAAVSGIRSAYTQAIASGRLEKHEVKRYWLTAADEMVCPVCTSVPVLNRKGIGVDDLYASISGPIEAPLAHPRCRCSERYVTDLSRLSEQPFARAA